MARLHFPISMVSSRWHWQNIRFGPGIGFSSGFELETERLVNKVVTDMKPVGVGAKTKYQGRVVIEAPFGWMPVDLLYVILLCHL